MDAQQLVVDLSSFVSPQAIIVANQAGNSIVITDTQANIRHLTEIIQSIDSSAEMETEIHVFTLKYANPNDVVATLSGVFPGSTGGAQNTINIGWRRWQRWSVAAVAVAETPQVVAANTAGVQKAQQVLAVADRRTQSVVVTAAKDMMPQISDMIAELDVDSTRDTDVYVLPVHNADPYEAAQVLQNMFQSTGASRTGSTSTSPLGQRAQQSSHRPLPQLDLVARAAARGGGGTLF